MSDYDQFARAYDERARISPYNAYHDRPAVLDLLGEVEGLQVLDAGCGSGLYAQELVNRGAQVVGFDLSQQMLQIAAERLGSAVQLHHHDLNEPLTWAAEASFDRAVMGLVIHYVPDPVPALQEIHRVLKPGGRLVVSTHHPFSDWVHLGGSYFADHMYQDTWSGGWEMRFRRRPLETIVQEFLQAGFTLETITETRPIAALQKVDPERWEKLNSEPTFLNLSVKKP